MDCMDSVREVLKDAEGTVPEISGKLLSRAYSGDLFPIKCELLPRNGKFLFVTYSGDECRVRFYDRIGTVWKTKGSYSIELIRGRKTDRVTVEGDVSPDVEAMIRHYG